jgi:hypothetical protein
MLIILIPAPRSSLCRRNILRPFARGSALALPRESADRQRHVRSFIHTAVVRGVVTLFPDGWKPTSTKPPVLASFILASLALGAIIEFLAQKSLKEGGLCLTQDADNASAGVILSRYGPTAIAVIYSLTWTWIDLDIRRIQPWLELSRADGGTADSTLLLEEVSHAYCVSVTFLTSCIDTC